MSSLSQSVQKQITSWKQFDPSRVTYKPVQKSDRGGKSVGITYNGQKLTIKFPMMLTWGANEWPNEQTGYCKYDMSLQFNPDRYQYQGEWLRKIKEFEEKLKNDAINNSKEWFGKTKLSRDVVDATFNPLLKYPKQKDARGEYINEPDYTRDPTLKLKLPKYKDKWSMSLFNMDGTPLFVPGDNYDGPSPHTLIPKAAMVTGLMECRGMWFVGGKCGITWAVSQLKVRPQQRLGGSAVCAIEDDSDDEEVVAALNKKDEEEQEGFGGDYEGEDNGPTFDDDDEDEEEEEEEEVVVAPVVKKKVKRKVKKKKKVAQEA